MGDMPVGECCVCEEPLDHSDAGFCDDCGAAFCWSGCGGWGPDGHRCNNCGGDEDDVQEEVEGEPTAVEMGE